MTAGVQRIDRVQCALPSEHPMSDDRCKLLELLAKYAYDFKVGGFKLASGKPSDEYLDCKCALSHAEALAPLGRVFCSEIDVPADAVGGLTMGADPIAISIACASGTLRWFSVRKEAKKHGRKKLIEGDVHDGERVVVVDDVVTSGGSTVQALEKCRESGLVVVQVIVLVDREQDDGMARIRDIARDIQVRAIFKKSEVAAQWRALNHSRKTA